MIRILSYVLLGVIASAVTIQLGFDPADLLEGLGEPSSVLIWITLGGLGGLLLGLLVQAIAWTIRTLSGNWTRLGREEIPNSTSQIDHSHPIKDNKSPIRRWAEINRFEGTFRFTVHKKSRPVDDFSGN